MIVYFFQLLYSSSGFFPFTLWCYTPVHCGCIFLSLSSSLSLAL